MLFPERLSWAVKKSGKTQLQIGTDAGISAGAMYNYVTGKRFPDIDVAARLAKAAGTTLSFLSGESSDPDFLTPSTSDVGEVLVEKSLAILGRPHLDDLAAEIGASPKQVRDWIAGKAQPSHDQLVRLFNKVAEASEPIAILFHGAAVSAKPARSTRKEPAAA